MPRHARSTASTPVDHAADQEVPVGRRPLVAVALTATLALSGSLLVGSAALASESDRHPAGAAPGRDGNDKAKKKKKPVTIKVATTPLGKVLVTTKGFTLYSFDPDGTDTVAPKCIDACADVWPAYVATKKTKGVGKGLDKSLLGIGGGGQVVYNDHLLYLFSGDAAAGETNGNGVGGVWHAVGSDGNPLA
jgi:predicted lipoprotein with Yx(FWY)xxD motif